MKNTILIMKILVFLFLINKVEAKTFSLENSTLFENNHLIRNFVPGSLSLVSESLIKSNGIAIVFTLKNSNTTEVSVKNINVHIKLVSSRSDAALTWDNSVDDFNLVGSGTYKISKDLFTAQQYENLASGAYVISCTYKINEKGFSQPLTFFRKEDANQITTYEVNKNDYQGLSVYTLKGGMSAEYAVQKSLAALSGGISHTWEVRTRGEESDGGGPVSVYSTPHFLKKSIEKTVGLYNTHLGETTSFNTVIISVGVPSAPYLSYYMGAPILPLHFLAAVNSISEVETMTNTAIKDGYSSYATAAYDPSMHGDGVAWIKLLDLPEEYRKFITDHNVQNVIFMGASEGGWGEVMAQRVKFKYPVDNPETYEEGSVYIMQHGGTEGLNTMKRYYKDYDDYSKEPQKAISDWESGIVTDQINNFKISITGMASNPKFYVIEGSESMGFYNIGMDLSIKFWKKNEALLGSSPVTGVAMNEYLIGYPAYENRVGQIPLFYWQIGEDNLAARVKNLLHYKVTSAYPNLNFKGLKVKFNAQFDRTPFINAVKNVAGMTNVTQNNWQKTDVWNPADGMDAPSELVAKEIINRLGGTLAFKNLTTNLTKLTVDDLKSMALNATPNSLTHPKPDLTTNVASIPDAGLEIKRYEFVSQPYWNSREQLKEIGFYDFNMANPTLLGYIDGYSKTGNERKQRITISQFDLGNTSDEYDLKIGYKFHPKEDDGFRSYDASKGDEQNMDCFAYTKVPKTSWLDIPSRVMAREGAVWIVNGSVYDWDYNGVPGVVPYIKKNDTVKAQPQILSYKGEGAFAWKWGANKEATIMGRAKEVPKEGLSDHLKTIFHYETSIYPNVLAGMTFMNGGSTYDIKALQPICH